MPDVTSELQATVPEWLLGCDMNLVNVTREYPFEHAQVVLGMLAPCVVGVSLITNLIVVFVLTRRHMRTPTNMVLCTMAAVQMLTLLCGAPWYLYIYTFGHHSQHLAPAATCYAHHIMSDVLPVYFHTANIWLTVLLAAQRYVYVCHPILASQWCTTKRIRRAIASILLGSLVSQLPRLVDNTFQTLQWQVLEMSPNSFKLEMPESCDNFIVPNNALIARVLPQQHPQANRTGDVMQVHQSAPPLSVVLACRQTIASWVLNVGPDWYFTSYFMFRIFFVSLVPCVALISLNCILYRTLKKAQRKRSLLLRSRYILSAREVQNAAPPQVGGGRGNGAGDASRLATSDPSSSSSPTQREGGAVPRAVVNQVAPTANKSHAIVVPPPPTKATSGPPTGERKPQQQPPEPQKPPQRQQSLRSLDSIRTTSMLVVVVSVFLAIELPTGLATIVHVISNWFDVPAQMQQSLNYIKLYSNFAIMISYSLNFPIYCCMSHRFRRTFVEHFWTPLLREPIDSHPRR